MHRVMCEVRGRLQTRAMSRAVRQRKIISTCTEFVIDVFHIFVAFGVHVSLDRVFRV